MHNYSLNKIPQRYNKLFHEMKILQSITNPPIFQNKNQLQLKKFPSRCTYNLRSKLKFPLKKRS